MAAVLGSLRNCGSHPRRSPQRDLVTAAARIPSSKLETVRRFAPGTATSTLAGEVPENIDENHLYEAMDWLVERQGSMSACREA